MENEIEKVHERFKYAFRLWREKARKAEEAIEMAEARAALTIEAKEAETAKRIKELNEQISDLTADNERLQNELDVWSVEAFDGFETAGAVGVLDLTRIDKQLFFEKLKTNWEFLSKDQMEIIENVLEKTVPKAGIR